MSHATGRLEDPNQNELNFENTNGLTGTQIANQADHEEQYDELPPVKAPYLPPLSDREQTRTYTLVLDLDETLIHYFEMGGVDGGGHFLIRPFALKFLREMSQIYEIVIFTAAMQDYADWVLDQLDPENYIKYRLYR